MFRLDGSAFCSDDAELRRPGCDASKGQRSTGQGWGAFWAERIKVGLIKDQRGKRLRFSSGKKQENRGIKASLEK